MHCAVGLASLTTILPSSSTNLVVVNATIVKAPILKLSQLGSVVLSDFCAVDILRYFSAMRKAIFATNNSCLIRAFNWFEDWLPHA